MKKRISTFKASNTSQTLTRHSQARVHRGTQNAMGTNQQDTKITTTQNNMENHRSLQRTLLQAEIQKNSQKQAFTYSDSKQNGKELFDLLPSANMRNQKSNIHDTTCRFNTRTQKNLKEHLTVHSDSQNPDAHRKKQPHKLTGR